MNHVWLYSDLVTGRLKHVLAGECHFKKLLPLLQNVNRRVIHEDVPTSDASKYIKSFNFKEYGYKQRSDFAHKIVESNNSGLCSIEIFPSCVYELQDDFTLDIAPDLKSELFQGLIADEFERVKARAIYFMASNKSAEDKSDYALTNLQLTKTVFHTSKAIFHDLFFQHSGQMQHPSVFIYYHINYFLIKVQMFYKKFFKHHISEKIETEADLITDLYTANLKTLQKRQITLQNYYNKRVKSEMEETTVTTYQGKLKKKQHGNDPGTSQDSTPEMDHPEPQIKIQIGEKIYYLRSKGKWNGPVNSLADILHQCMFEIFVDGKPLLEWPVEDAVDAVTIVLCDKNCNDFSKSTLRTDLQRSKSDKRPKPGSKGKIDIRKITGL